MGILQFIVLVCVIGFVVWLVQRFVPMDEKFKTIILWGAVIFCILMLLWAVGVLPIGHDVMMPRVR